MAVDRDQYKAIGYISSIGQSVVSGISGAVAAGTGAATAASSAAGPVGLVVMFVTVMINGIMASAQKNKLHQRLMSERGGAIQNMFSQNLILEEQCKAEILKKANADADATQDDVNEAYYAHIIIAICIILITIILCYLIFKKRK